MYKKYNSISLLIVFMESLVLQCSIRFFCCHFTKKKAEIVHIGKQNKKRKEIQFLKWKDYGGVWHEAFLY